MNRVSRKIIYFFIESSENGFIFQQGFNFSSRYHFKMIVENNGHVLREDPVDIDEKVSDDFFSPIGGVTAIVGQNGSGKTTLLKELCHLVGRNRTGDNSDKRYDEYYEYEYQKYKRLVVLEENKHLVCYHNIDTLRISLEYSICSEVNYYRDNTALMNDLLGLSGPYGFSTIAFSNSYYFRNTYENANFMGNGIMESSGMLTETYLTPETIAIYASDFYKQKIKRNDRIAGGYYQFLDMCIRKRSESAQDFQQILDIFYLRECDDVEITKWFRPSFIVSVLPASYYFREILDDMRGNAEKGDGVQMEEASYERTVFEVYQAHSKLIYGIDIKDICNNLILQLYINLLFDMLFLERVNDDLESIQNKGYRRFSSDKDLYEFINGRLKDSTQKYGRLSKYLEEIKAFEVIVSKCHSKGCLLPVGDMAYKNEMVISQETEEYSKFINFICECALRDEESFILRYIQISGLTVSSGERALLNFVTWQNMISHQDELIHKKKRILQDNILILIDEIDLYLHPEWQQRFLFEFSKLLSRLYPSKNIQLIYTTHSPITLSDMPRGAVIFLRNSEYGKCTIDDSFRHCKTFGSNIYLLYNDAFFLKEAGQIGEFAKNKIKKIIDALKPVVVNGTYEYLSMPVEEIEIYRTKISIIGDPIIRKQLFKMLERHSIEARGITLLEKRIKELENRLSELQRLRDRDDSD